MSSLDGDGCEPTRRLDGKAGASHGWCLWLSELSPGRGAGDAGSLGPRDDSHPDTDSGAGKPIFGDVYEPASLNPSAASCENQLIIVRIDIDRAALKPLPKLLVP